MQSIFASSVFNTSILTFPASFLGDTVDDRGSTILTNSEPLIISAYLRHKLQPKDTNDYMSTLGTIELWGRLIEPAILPSTIKVGSIGEGLINGIDGRIELLPISQSAIAGLDLILGQRIRVNFTTRLAYVGVS